MIRRAFRWLASLFQAPDRRALLLRILAEDAAALAVALNPNAAWAQLLSIVVQQLAAMPDVPTRNTSALQRVAAMALAKHGVKP